MNEEWRPVPGYEVEYEVSSLGRVRSRQRIDSRGHSVRERILKTPLSAGYPCFRLWRENASTCIRVHQAVAIAFLGPPPSPGAEVNHKNLDRTDNRVENLEWTTHLLNIQHARDNGRLDNRRRPTPRRGEERRDSKLTDASVREIRRLRTAGATLSAIAQQFDVSVPLVHKIVHRRSRAHVED